MNKWNFPENPSVTLYRRKNAGWCMTADDDMIPIDKHIDDTAVFHAENAAKFNRQNQSPGSVNRLGCRFHGHSPFGNTAKRPIRQ